MLAAAERPGPDCTLPMPRKLSPHRGARLALGAWHVTAGSRSGVRGAKFPSDPSDEIPGAVGRAGSWKKVTQFRQQGAQHVSIEATVATLAGTFAVPNPQWFIEVGSALSRVDRRIILDVTKAGRPGISQHVKAEVWARDGGACRQCGSDVAGRLSLEFDHIIPVALGGATSTENLRGAVSSMPMGVNKGARI